MRLLIITCAFSLIQLVTGVDPTVQISLGRIRGSRMSSAAGRNFMAFRGIPYAKPPVGDLRFQDPIPVDSWDDELDATHEGSKCIQIDLSSHSVQGAEDCLVLNVYTHSLNSDALRSVMVWIHGGAWYARSGNGENDIYGPHYIMDADVVLVTLNYRLGALGFYTTNTAEAPGNYGLLDQSMALKWIQDHIQSFGGDPKSVTLFGESAGGASVHYHILSPRSRGLFHRAIAQSGSSLCSWGRREEVGKHSFYLAKKIGCWNKTAEAQVKCMRTKPAEDLLLTPKMEHMPAIVFGPRVDFERENPFLPSPPEDLLRSGKFSQVPLLAGVNQNEGLMFLAESGLIGGTEERMKEFEEDPNKSLMYMLGLQDVKEPNTVVQKALLQYTDKTRPLRHQIKELEEMISDYAFFKCVDDMVQLQTLHSPEPVFYYYYTYLAQKTISEFHAASTREYGVSHADELLMLFTNSLMSLESPDDFKMSQILIDLWTSFAIHGQPRSDSVPEWLPTSKDQPRYLNIHLNPSLVEDKMPFQDRLPFWDFIPPPPVFGKDEL